MTKINSGKRFEQNWKNSIPKDIFYYRFRDGSSSWGGNDKVRFQQTNICDCLMFDGDYLYLLELKSTKGKSLPFNNIKEHQIKDLLWASVYANTICGLVIEFSELSECYFIEISQFKEFYDTTDRKSISIDYLRENGIKICVEKKKINSCFDINKFIKEIIERVI
jgi:recombination protein U